MNGGLHFTLDDVVRECMAMGRLAYNFLEPTSRNTLIEAAKRLRQFAAEPTRPEWTWEIPRERRLVTCSSRGYEVGGTGRRLQGTLSFAWRIRVLRPTRRRSVAREFELLDGATHMSWIDPDYPEPALVAWHLDVGTAGQPGARVHVQMDNDHQIPVPRLPMYMATPSDALDFILGELFQYEWPFHQYRYFQSRNEFSRVQRQRISQILRVMQEEIRTTRSTTPLIKLKKWSPPHDLFVI